MLRLYEASRKDHDLGIAYTQGCDLKKNGAVLSGQPLMFNICSVAGWMRFIELELPQARRRTR